ncbi:MAG: aminotransferase class III-fold pyridoxal phosphate-dependent enzyme [Deferribacterales bacterium]
MEHLMEIYKQKFSKSEALFQKYKNLFPLGISHDIRSFEPFPFVVEKSEKGRIYTIDGIRLVDLWMGHYTNILGHCNPQIVDQVAKISRKLTQIGIVNRLQGELAEIIKEAVPEMELIRFTTSGTEATMYATRLAKKFTNRDIIAKIEGGWHGGNSDLSFDVKPPYTGIKNGVISIPYNNTEKSLEILEKFRNKIAGIILEPVMGAGGGVKVEERFLKSIKEYCNQTDSLLIFDETITGFRFRYGSIYPILGVKPDLFTMGKIIGGGFAIGLYGGRKDVLSLIEKKEIITGGGTFSEHPVTMAAGITTLTLLKNADYDKLNDTGDLIRKEVSKFIEKYKPKAFVSGYGSMIALHFYNCSKNDIDPKQPSTFLPFSDPKKENLFKIAMILNGVYTMHSGGALSFAHNKKDIDIIINGYKKSFKAIRDE